MPHSTPIIYPSIIIPRRRAVIVSRSRPLALLEQSLDHQLLLLVSPPGYGKTCLLVDFARSARQPVCWYTIDAYDQEPGRFLAHFTASIARQFPDFGQATEAALHSLSGQYESPDALIQILVSELHQHAPQRFILILDDFQHVDEQPFIAEFLSRFLERTRETCCLVIASRRRPRLEALDRLAAYDQVAGLTERDLAFRGAEIQALARQNYHVEVSAEDAEDLAQRTEGWITGLLLSNPAGWEARAAQLRAVSEHTAHLEHYWARLLNEQPAEVLDFLLYASLLDDFSAGLCAEAFAPLYPQGADWRGLFDSVLRYNLFAQSIDQNGGWVHLHSLLREYLQARLKAEKPAEYAILLGRLVQVYIQRGEWEKAYACQEKLGGAEDLAALIEQAGTPMIRSGRYEAIQRWIDALPAQVLASRPGLLSLKGITATIGPRIADALPLLDQAVALFNEHQDIPMLGRSLARRGSVRHYLGHYQQALNDARCLLAATRHDPDLLDLRAEALLQCGTNLRFLGQPSRASRYLRKALALYTCLGQDFNAASVRHNLGLVLRSLGCYEQARQSYQQALDYWRATANPYRIADVLNDLGVLHHYCGDFTAAQSACTEALDLARSSGYVRMEGFLLSSFGALYADLDAFVPANAAYRQARRLAEQMQHRYLAFYLDCVEAALARRQNDFPTAHSFLVSARQLAESGSSASEQAAYLCEEGLLFLAEGEAQAAAERFTQSLQIYRQRGWMLEQALLGLYQAAALAASGQPDAAKEQLRQALEVRQELNEPGCMVSEGRLVKTLLQRQRSDPLAARFLAQVEAFEKELPTLRRRILQQPAVEGVALQPKLVLQTLGKTQVLVDGQCVPGTAWKSETARDVLFYLLSHPQGLTRSMAATLFWPTYSPDASNAALRNSIYAIRQIIGKDAVLFQDDRYYFNRSLDYVYDAESFLQTLAGAEQASSDNQREQVYRQAIAMYQGAYLDDSYSSWVATERERLRQAYLDAVLRLADLHLSQRDFRTALQLGLDLCEQEPYLEEAHCLLMQAYAGMGNQADLIRQYRRCCQLLEEHFEAATSPKTQSLYKSLTGG